MDIREIIVKPKLDYSLYIEFKHLCLDLGIQPSKRVAQLIMADVSAAKKPSEIASLDQSAVDQNVSDS